MEFSDVVRRRRMVRDYTDQPVDPAVITRALANATRAPSAGFTQGWGFVVRDTPDAVRRWWAAAAGPERQADPDRWLTGMMRAPVVIVPCSSRAAYLERYDEADKSDRPRTSDGSPWSVPYWHMDTAMAALLILQTAVDAGLGGCFAGIALERETAVRQELGLPDGVDPIGVITLGHPATPAPKGGSPARRSRRPADEVVHRDTWNS